MNYSHGIKLEPIYIELFGCYLNSHSLRLAQLLATHPDININKRNNDGITCLHQACRHGSIEIVKELLKHEKININIVTEYEWDTPIREALLYLNFDIVRLLLSHKKIDVCRKNRDGYTLLSRACSRDAYDLIRDILKQTFMSRDPTFPLFTNKNTRLKYEPSLKRIQFCVVIVSAKLVKRIGYKSFVTKLPFDLISLLCKNYLLLPYFNT